MEKWKNLRENPPRQNCSICLKIGQHYEACQFIRHSEVGWSLFEYGREFDPTKIPTHTLYINLDEIEIDNGL